MNLYKVVIAAMFAIASLCGDAADVKTLTKDPSAIEAGKTLYVQSCGGCHGVDAKGGRGPNLASGERVGNLYDEKQQETFLNTVQNGIPGTDMPPAHLSRGEALHIGAFLWSLSTPASNVHVPGDADAGRAVFFGKGGCVTCHRMGDTGGHLGPDLSGAGTKPLQFLEEAIVSPGALVADGYRGIRVETKRGRAVSGIARENTIDEMVVRDNAGNDRRFSKRELKQITWRTSSLMPQEFAKSLLPAEFQNLLAFLSKQTRETPQKPIPPVRYTDILAGPGQNWLTYSGSYSGTRHSSLAQINVRNASRLTLSWTYHVERVSELRATPLVMNGVMYITANTNEVHAIDAARGTTLWKYTDKVAQKGCQNRGAALLGDRIFFVTCDVRLTAIRRQDGAFLWSKQYADPAKGYYASVAPLALQDRIIVGVSGGETGMRGFVAAFSPEDGKELWRFWTVPARGEKGSETWGDLIEWGGAATWLTGTFDPEFNLIYWPTGNPWPDFIGKVREGDNLYSNSVAALDADTGKLVWHFQFTPHDTHDWDATEIPVLADITFRGRLRKVLMQANRNGFFYVLDRTNGEFLFAKPFVEKLNWASGIDARGRPIEIPGTEPTPGGVKVCPTVWGATNWQSPSYNPLTNLFYVVALEKCEIMMSTDKKPEPLKDFMGTGNAQIPNEDGRGFVRAIDAATGKRQWEYPMGSLKPDTPWPWPGVLSTAGGLLFFGDHDGHLVAVDAKNGKHLWHAPTGRKLCAAPMTYMVGGKQYVSIVANADILTFALHEPVRPVPLVPETIEP